MRYLLFAGPRYYPGGGAYDVIARLERPEDVRLDDIDNQQWNGSDMGWAHLYDLESGKVIAAWELEREEDGYRWSEAPV